MERQAPQASGARIGVDTGGTFTDLVYVGGTGELRVTKVPSTPAGPERAVLTAVQQTLSEPELAAVTHFVHGTTVGLNALLTRSGGPVALLCTDGHRDVLEIRRGRSDDPYQVFVGRHRALVRRSLRLPLRERVGADGSIVVRLEEGDVRRAAATLEREGIAAVAVALINSYANPEHELAVERLLREAGYAGELSLSHRISGEYGEYPRTSTTVVDAYVRSATAGYLDRLDSGLRELGFTGALLLTRSGGGAFTAAEAVERPFEVIMSGPVAGAAGAADLGVRLGMPEVVAADVGGTSFDTCLVEGGKLPLEHQGEIIGMPLQTPWIDVRSIGAGGGSLCRVDAAGRLRVGPESAGARPGPAAYGYGGEVATLTDAAVVLGLLPSEGLAGGLELDHDAALAAVGAVAEGLGLDRDDAAHGIIAIAAANMANPIREIAVERGADIRGAALVAFGGMGPLLGGLIARELDMRTVVVPFASGVFSAVGLLSADIVRTAARTSIQPIDDDSLDAVNGVLAELFEQLAQRAAVSRDGGLEVALDLRYSGQKHHLTLDLPSDGGALTVTAREIRERFERTYRRLFDLTLELPVETVASRATSRTTVATNSLTGGPPESALTLPAARATAWSFTRRRREEFAVHRREHLPRATVVAGPALVLEGTATTYIDAGFEGVVHDDGSLVLTDLDA
jgi:N-methylhydantoinase A